jgi:protein-tyrosine phosphatase
MASALFAAQIQNLTEPVSVSSAGIRARQGSIPTSVPDEVLEVMDAYGIDLRRHQSQALNAPMLRQADLVIGMSRRHVQEAILLDAGSWPHAFMLKELVRRGDLVGPRRPTQDVSSWLEAVHGDRTRAALVHRSSVDEVVDPYGGTLAEYRSTAAELTTLTSRMAELMWPSGREDRAAPP